MSGWAHATEHVQRSENELRELVLSLYHVGTRNQTEAVRHGSKCLYSLNNLPGP